MRQEDILAIVKTLKTAGDIGVYDGERTYKRLCTHAAEIITKLEAERRRFDIALQDLTPGGSEYVNDPERCVAFVKELKATLHRLVVERTKERNKCRETLKALGAIL